MLTLLAFFVMALFHTENSHLDLEYGPGIVEKLKTKFHRLAGVGRSTSRVLKQTHSSSVFNNNYGDDEPEFLRVARSLRRKAGYAEDVQSDCECKLIDEGVGKQSGWHSLKSYQKVVFPMRSTEIPTLSKNARVEEDDFYVENTSSTTTSSTRAAQIIPSSTEPPIPPRQSFSSSYVTESSAFAPSRAVICDPSPSEERKTSQDTFSSEHRGSTHERFEASSLPKISPRTAESKFSQPSTVSNLFSPQIILRNNDASGMVEMQKLLDKFQRTRAERQLNMAEYPSPTQSLSSSTITVTNRQDISVAVSDAILFQQSRSHTVVSVRSSDLSTSSPSSQIHYLEKDSSPGIVSISVKEDENMFSHGRRIHNTSMSSSTEPPPVVKHPIHSPLLWKSSRLEQLDNDLPSNYEEWKKEDEKKMHSEAQHATESHTLSKVSQAASVCKESDDVQNLYYTDFENNIVAGDGNLVSHTLLNLAMEEDIPALMEAMHETYSFEFEDLKDETPSSSSILHTPETRKARRKARQILHVGPREVCEAKVELVTADEEQTKEPFDTVQFDGNEHPALRAIAAELLNKLMKNDKKEELRAERIEQMLAEVLHRPPAPFQGQIDFRFASASTVAILRKANEKSMKIAREELSTFTDARTALYEEEGKLAKFRQNESTAAESAWKAAESFRKAAESALAAIESAANSIAAKNRAKMERMSSNREQEGTSRQQQVPQSSAPGPVYIPYYYHM
ncbi:hypothetical protein Q1695_000401 [Nippostrongylus brasiliensis]|nr:hypothetical protein Q1695_000401 [Nippostrongylus brasiliensis]